MFMILPNVAMFLKVYGKGAGGIALAPADMFCGQESTMLTISDSISGLYQKCTLNLTFQSAPPNPALLPEHSLMLQKACHAGHCSRVFPDLHNEAGNASLLIRPGAQGKKP
jgi:hypothetical protein